MTKKPCIGCEEKRKTKLKATDPIKLEKELEIEANETEVKVYVIKKLVSIGWKIYNKGDSLIVPKERLPGLKGLVE